VLDTIGGTLAIYTTAEEHMRGARPKGIIRNLKSMVVVRLRADDGSGTLAVLPREAFEQPILSPRADDKSWYLRAADEESTADWFSMLGESGAQVVDRGPSQYEHLMGSAPSASFSPPPTGHKAWLGRSAPSGPSPGASASSREPNRRSPWRLATQKGSPAHTC